MRVTAVDTTGARIPNAVVRLSAPSIAVDRSTRSDKAGLASTAGLLPGAYTLSVSGQGFATAERHVELAVGDDQSITVVLQPGSATTDVTVKDDPDSVDTTSPSVSTVIREVEVSSLPLNGRRFTDLALITPNVVQDPRSLTATSHGDLAFGGIRGFNTSYVVDGADNNNGFFAQSRGRLRSPYQFSNETIKEFRVSTNTFGVEQGRSSGAVINVVTKSGTNTHHGSFFYYLRDGAFAATHPFVRKKYPDKQHQFGFSVGGPLKKDKIFYFAGFDQHIFHVPTVVQFENGAPAVVPSATSNPRDYETAGFAGDEALVRAAAAQLSGLAGNFKSELGGNAAFAKFDFNLSHRHRLTTRINVSRYYGANNVFSDPTNPITTFAISGNGEESVTTTTFTNNLMSVLGERWISQARLQISRDGQSSRANSNDVATNIHGIISGFGRSSILPRHTNENRFQFAESLNHQNARHAVKVGMDLLITTTDNYFPRNAGGEFIFDKIKVNPFTFKPQLAGLELSPLRAYAHRVPRYYLQDFGAAESHPDTNEYAWFVQDTVRIGDRLALTAGLRYDLQTFRQPEVPSIPLWPDAGRMPNDHNNFAPRIGLAAMLGDKSDPFVVRGGFGVFYTRIPQIYNSSVELENGSRSHLFMDNSKSAALFPAYPDALVDCPPGETQCSVPTNVTSLLSTNVSTFDVKRFRTPYVQQASLSIEKRVAPRTDVTFSYLFVGGRHLIRSRDVNLPEPKILTFPVFNEDGTFSGDLYDVASFGTIQNVVNPTVCAFPPCLVDPVRPNPELGAVSVFETSASSTYHGFTLSAEHRMTKSFTARVGYTWAKAIDDIQDALTTDHSDVQNPFAMKSERSLSVTDQRHRFVSAVVIEPNPFGRDHTILARFFNDWRISSILSAGSGRPLSGQVTGDANRDGNFFNDRLPGVSRNSFIGPDYLSTSARITRRFFVTEQWRLEATAEAFNVFNRNNKRLISSDSGTDSTAAEFVTFSTKVNGIPYPAHFTRKSAFLLPKTAYAPRQVQLSLRLKW